MYHIYQLNNIKGINYRFTDTKLLGWLVRKLYLAGSINFAGINFWDDRLKRMGGDSPLFLTGRREGGSRHSLGFIFTVQARYLGV